MARQIFFIALITFIPLTCASQSESKSNKLRLEIGLGTGYVEQGSGLGGRAAFSLFLDKWSITARTAYQDGRNGKYIPGGHFGSYYIEGWYITESYWDKAIIVSREIYKTQKFNIFGGMGMGDFNGEKLTSDGSNTFKINKTYGLAYEIGIASTGKFLGLSSHIWGNMNKEAFCIGIVVGLTFGIKF